MAGASKKELIEDTYDFKDEEENQAFQENRHRQDEESLKLLQEEVKRLTERISTLESKIQSEQRASGQRISGKVDGSIEKGDLQGALVRSPVQEKRDIEQELFKVRSQRDDAENKARQLQLKLESFRREEECRKNRQRELEEEKKEMQEFATRSREVLSYQLARLQDVLNEKRRELEQSRLENQRNVKVIKELQSRLRALEEDNANKKGRPTNDVIQRVSFVVEKVKDGNAHLMEDIRLSKLKLNCFSCGEDYTLERNADSMCRFHPLQAMPFKYWCNWLELRDINKKNYQNYRYYICCNKLAKTRPPGCFVGRHHQSWESDILLKFALNISNPNFQTMLEQTTHEVTIVR